MHFPKIDKEKKREDKKLNTNGSSEKLKLHFKKGYELMF